MNKSAPLAIQDVSAAQKGGGKSKAIKGKGNKGKADKGKGTKGKGTGKTEYVIGTGSRFDDLMASAGVLQRLHKQNQNTPGFCYNFPSRRCQGANCLRFHACAGCNTAHVAYADCFCLATA